jgi:hypothetical protein
VERPAAICAISLAALRLAQLSSCRLRLMLQRSPGVPVTAQRDNMPEPIGSVTVCMLTTRVGRSEAATREEVFPQ